MSVKPRRAMPRCVRPLSAGLVISLAALLGACGGEPEPAQPESPPAEAVLAPRDVEVRPAEPAPGSAISEEDAQRIELARAVLEKIDDALAALDLKEQDSALRELRAAREAVDKLMASGPTMAVAEKVIASDREVEHRYEIPIGPDLVPLLRGVSRTVEIVPEPAALEEALKAPASGGLVVADAALRYHELALPVGGTSLRLAAAQQLTEEGRLEEARQVLADAVLNLEAIELAVDAPIIRARRSFRCARLAFAAGDRDASMRCLAEASAAVKEAATDKQATAAERQAAVALADDIGRLREALSAGTVTDAEGFKGLSARFWGATQRWAARTSVARSESKQLGAAADALYALEAAEAYQFYDADPKRALKQRQKAREHLEDGLEAADDALRPRFVTALALMDAVDRTPLVADSAEARAALDELEFELRRILYEL